MSKQKEKAQKQADIEKIRLAVELIRMVTETIIFISVIMTLR